ncbi:ABC transporter G family member 25 [Vitis vinifera]|uniref:ABC transporter G family member 25 n=1 Tax=Vitis vinifera TaxID=29760 RepID=A0A438JW07_VITVI|nr:ABC transporter G family member 25 [Vitis vinifera]
MPVMGGGDAPNGGASEGSERVKPSSQDSRDLNFLMASCYPISLKFIDICYRVKLEKKKSRGGICRPMLGGPTKSSDRGSTTETIQEKTILNGVTGMACPGEILAVLGRHPLSPPHSPGNSHLLLAASLAQHPHKQEKISLADSVIAELGLAKCENTIIGNSFIRGVSGGERKRAGFHAGVAGKQGEDHSNIHAPALQSSLPDVSLCARLVRRQMLVLWKGKPSHELLRNCWLHAVFSHEPS